MRGWQGLARVTVPDRWPIAHENIAAMRTKLATAIEQRTQSQRLVAMLREAVEDL